LLLTRLIAKAATLVCLPLPGPAVSDDRPINASYLAMNIGAGCG
jgi:hypothetical protein